MALKGGKILSVAPSRARCQANEAAAGALPEHRPPWKAGSGMPSNGSGFLERWSRRKREPRSELAEAVPDPAPLAESPKASDEPLPTLSDLDGIGPDGDIRAFLRERVPAELKRLALRKAWATDPAIAGHRSLADYDWDFNAPGYGALAPDDDVGRLAAAIFREPVVASVSNDARSGTQLSEVETQAPEVEALGAGSVPLVAAPLRQSVTTASVEAATEVARDRGRGAAPPDPRRRHGRAVPI
jgi:hypothetical protein